MAPMHWIRYRARLSLPSRGAWIEIIRKGFCCDCYESLPSRGAWIEMTVLSGWLSFRCVAPLAGSVDRNMACANVHCPV